MILNDNSTQQINTLVIQLQNKITNLNNEIKKLNNKLNNDFEDSDDDYDSDDVFGSDEDSDEDDEEAFKEVNFDESGKLSLAAFMPFLRIKSSSRSESGTPCIVLYRLLNGLTFPMSFVQMFPASVMYSENSSGK